MYISSIGQILNIEGWHLGLSTLSVILAFVVTLWNVNRARKKDFNDIIIRKADKEVVKKDFQTRDEKINSLNVRITDHEKHNVDQYTNLKEHLEELNASIGHIHGRVDKIYEKLTR